MGELGQSWAVMWNILHNKLQAKANISFISERVETACAQEGWNESRVDLASRCDSVPRDFSGCSLLCWARPLSGTLVTSLDLEQKFFMCFDLEAGRGRNFLLPPWESFIYCIYPENCFIKDITHYEAQNTFLCWPWVNQVRSTDGKRGFDVAKESPLILAFRMLSERKEERAMEVGKMST